MRPSVLPEKRKQALYGGNRESGQRDDDIKIDSKTVQAVAARLREAAETGKAIPPIRDELAGGGVEAAYAIQQANTEHALKQGRRLVGRKGGLTSKSVQKQLCGGLS